MANSIKVKATFIGKDGSRGFVKAKEYTLKLSKYPTDGNLLADDVKSLNYCEYGSFIAFLNNWDNIKNIKK